jgi:hypothetical protein
MPRPIRLNRPGFTRHLLAYKFRPTVRLKIISSLIAIFPVHAEILKDYRWTNRVNLTFSNSEEILEEEPLPLLEIFQEVIQPEILEKEEIATNRNENAEEIPLQDVKILHLEINEIHSKKAVEISQHLQEASIKDLRKAIGINDKYLFINELFGGDEKLFENSIKTINQFNIFAEADFWIKKELIAIKKWNLDLPVVEQFMLLVKRRFS